MTTDTNSRRDFLVAGAALAAATLAAPQTADAQAAGGRVTAHVLDLYTGTPANGLKIDLLAMEGNTSRVLKSVVTNVDGRPPEGPLLTPDTMKTGRYQAVVYVGDYYKKIGAKLPGGYYTKLILEFDIYDAKSPHHLPFQITPWTQSASVLPG
jgi:5-hydroxyisourate hydrolase